VYLFLPCGNNLLDASTPYVVYYTSSIRANRSQNHYLSPSGIQPTQLGKADSPSGQAMSECVNVGMELARSDLGRSLLVLLPGSRETMEDARSVQSG